MIEEFVYFTLKFAYFSPKQADLSSIKDNFGSNLQFLTGSRDGYRKHTFET